MPARSSEDSDQTEAYQDAPASYIIAQVTGRAAEEYDAGMPDFPEPDDLESVPESEW